MALNFKGKTLVFCGTSRTIANLAGPGARWASLFCQESNAVEYNLGISGASLTTDGIQFDRTTIPVYNAAVHGRLFFEYATNELKVVGGDLAARLANFKAIYLDTIAYAINTRGWPAALISVQTCFFPWCPNPDWVPRYNAAIAEVAAQYGLLLIDYYGAFANRPGVAALFDDGVHENATTGQRAVADFYESLSYAGSTPSGPRLRRRYASV